MPDHSVLILIADHFGLDYRNQYHEPGMLLHGETNYQHSKLEDIYLDGYDMDRYRFEGERFWYQNAPYKTEEEVIDLLVANKKAALAAGQFVQEAYTENFFVTKSQLSREEVAALYNDPPEGELLLPLAELKNFEAAKAIFDSWSEENVILMENYCMQEFQHLPRLNYSQEQYIALRFLDHLLTGWRQQHRIDYEDHPFLTRPGDGPDETNLGR
ncbi:hypothetical protein SAMN05216464_10810 [Mucilaginibacter pineti]|uniref:YubB ferredoxin-like domain-containing protein n=1 Tax=Mucilaginibacter pineti TaxID=1391627 RepID=A0A1G7EFZ4_9SPHI|nr:hypothetical protein [Mucilaginibacter pineti]SDE62569.1 hypothetical protein SAMN05216464_10810 [Mucilaginibacter pineti]